MKKNNKRIITKPQQRQKVNKSSNSKSKPIICWDCGQQGHTRRQCKLWKKIKELNIPEEEKDNLLSLLDDISDTSRYNALEIKESDKNSTSDSSNISDCNYENYNTIMELNKLRVNMITEQESLLLDLIESIPDKDQQRTLIENVIASTRDKKLKQKMEAVVKPLNLWMKY